MKYIAILFIVLPTIAYGQEFTTRDPSKAIEEMSKRMYKHYEVDDTINAYLLNKIKYGVSIVGPSKTKNSNSKFPQLVKKPFKQKVVLKNKNKIYWKFQPNHSFTINPSSFNRLTYSWKDIGSITIKQDGFWVDLVEYTW
tara:strand:- start:11 stop:430 length:420 start_codon:yes stop_codon:yes gene_type:complete